MLQLDVDDLSRSLKTWYDYLHQSKPNDRTKAAQRWTAPVRCAIIETENKHNECVSVSTIGVKCDSFVILLLTDTCEKTSASLSVSMFFNFYFFFVAWFLHLKISHSWTIELNCLLCLHDWSLWDALIWHKSLKNSKNLNKYCQTAGGKWKIEQSKQKQKHSSVCFDL